MGKFLPFIFCLLIHFFSDGQDANLELDIVQSRVTVPRIVAKNPVTLVNYLIKNKVTEKEKFDAIFTWVATNIKYNYSSYYSSSGASISKIKSLLKHRTGICIDYAFLMDSLCKLTNITNVSVYGYAKDEIFDVGDSLYIDNHAWNAVKLDNIWYLYDVTWASGQTEVKLRKLSNYLYHVLITHPAKYKKRELKNKKISFINYCDSQRVVNNAKTFYYKQKLLNKILRNYLLNYNYKTKRYLSQKLNKEYYLCNPDTFAINHFPDDPRWSLVASKTLRQIECDSNFFHITDSTYKKQIRIGRPSPDIDSYLSYSELNKQKIFRKESLKFNIRNRFAPTICEYNISKLIFNDCFDVEDSLTKVNIIDTSMAYLDLAKGSLYKSFSNIEQDFYLQREKNSKKMDVLLAENKIIRDFIYSDKYNTSLGLKSLLDLKRTTKMVDRKLERHLSRVKRIETNDKPNLKLKNSEIKLLELTQKSLKIDSIILKTNDSIADMKNIFENLAAELLKSIQYKITQQDSIFKPFEKTIMLRYSLQDNYKKSIIVLKRDINRHIQNYLRDIEKEVYKPSLRLQEIGERLFNAITYRNKLEENLFTVNAELIRRRQTPNYSLEGLKINMKNKLNEDLCWIQKRANNFKSINNSLDLIINKQDLGFNIIKAENQVEYQRFKYINKELSRRKRKYKKIILHNFKVVNFQTRVERKEKRNFLKKLRTERRELAKKNRKKLYFFKNNIKRKG